MCQGKGISYQVWGFGTAFTIGPKEVYFTKKVLPSLFEKEKYKPDEVGG